MFLKTSFSSAPKALSLTPSFYKNGFGVSEYLSDIRHISTFQKVDPNPQLKHCFGLHKGGGKGEPSVPPTSPTLRLPPRLVVLVGLSPRPPEHCLKTTEPHYFYRVSGYKNNGCM